MAKKILKKNAEELEKNEQELENQLKRVLADYQNLEKRVAQEQRDRILKANKDLILKLLPVLDNLYLANQHLKDEGLTLSIQEFLKVLDQEGVKEIGSTKGVQFDPNLMECVRVVEGEDGKVVEEVRTGYKMYDKIIRPAQVIVGKGEK